MQTQLTAEFKATRDGQAAEAILRKCVHCGFYGAWSTALPVCSSSAEIGPQKLRTFARLAV